MKIYILVLLQLYCMLGAIFPHPNHSPETLPAHNTEKYSKLDSILTINDIEILSHYVDELIAENSVNDQNLGEEPDEKKKQLRESPRVKNQDKIILSQDVLTQIQNKTQRFGISMQADFLNITLEYEQYLGIYKPEFLDNKGTDSYLYRHNIYLQNVQMINQFNNNPQNPFRMGLNPFTDIDSVQFGKFYKISINKRTRASLIVLKNIFRDKITSSQSNSTKPLIESFVAKFQNQTSPTQNKTKNMTKPPTKKLSIFTNYKKPESISVTWRNFSGQAKYQGDCNACYAFGVLDAIYISLKIRKIDYEPFSVQQIVSCASLKHDQAKGCQGGTSQSVYFYANTQGLGPSSLYPYTMQKSKNASQCDQTLIKSKDYINKKYLLPYDNFILPNDCREVVKILKRQVVSAVIMGALLQHYSDGVYKNINPEEPIDENKLDHLVTIVAYNHTDDTYMFKNAWGPLWAMKGYGITQKGMGVCLAVRYPIISVQ